MSIISSLSSIAASTQPSVNKANAGLQAAIAKLFAGSAVQSTSTNDIASLSLALQLQSQVSGAKQISSNLAQGSSLVEVASGGIDQIGNLLSQLQQIATQANSGTLSQNGRASLNEQFKQITASINQIVKSTTFGGNALLDGSLSGDSALSLGSLFSVDGSSGDTNNVLSIGDLSSSSLLGSAPLDVLSQADASAALTAIGSALTKLGSTKSSVASFQQTLGYAAATVDSAVFNQDAALSELNDSDFVQGATGLSLAVLQQNSATALAAQTNRLPPSMLELLK